jgi:PmbA protein
VAELRSEEMVNYGEKAVKTAIRKGADEAEAFLSGSSSTVVGIERGQIVRNVKGLDQGLGVRVIYKKAVGFSYTNILTDKTITDVAVRACNSAKASKPDENWVGLVIPRKFNAAKGTYDKRLTAIASHELVEMASVALNAAEDYDKRVSVVGGGVGAVISSRVVVNSYGVNVHDEGTAIQCSIETVAKEAHDVTPECYEFDSKRIQEIEPEWVGREAARQAVSSLKAQKSKSGRLSVVFSQLASFFLLYFTVINAVKADYVQRERSALKGKIGTKIASDLVTIHDDGLLEGGLQTWKFDGEGVPSQKTLVIDKGVLKNYLYDNYTAKKVGVESTGNAVRRGMAPYATTPHLEATNFTITPGKKPPEEIIREVDEGNPESGEFSVVATPAWKIENGSIAYAVKGTMLAGTIFDVLKNVSTLGNNTRKIGRIAAPWIQVENVRVVGRK